MSADNLSNIKFTLSVRNIFDIAIVIFLSIALFKQVSMREDIDSLVLLMEKTSNEATKKIQSMSNAGLGLNDVSVNEIDGRKSGYADLEASVGRVGAIRVTEKLKVAFGPNIKIVVNPSPDKSSYIATIGKEQFTVSSDGNYIVIDGINVPLSEKEYLAFKESEQFNVLNQNKVTSDAPSQTKRTNNSGSNKVNQAETKNKLELIYGDNGKLPGLTISHEDYDSRVIDFNKAKTQAILFKGIDAKRNIYVFFDISCPSCKKFFDMIPLYQSEGYNVHLMLIDKTKKFTSESALKMASIYCEKDRKSALIATIKDDSAPNQQCPHGGKFLESMTNAALLVGTVGTPSLFTEDAVPIYVFDESKNKYNPVYNFNGVETWMDTNGY